MVAASDQATARGEPDGNPVVRASHCRRPLVPARTAGTRCDRIPVRRAALRAPNIMKHTLRCHGFGDAGPAARLDSAMGTRRTGRRGPKPRQPTRGCGQNRRRAEAWSRGPGFRGCDRAGVHRTVGIGALMSRSGVASKHTPLGTCSALHGTFVARLANTASIGCTSLRASDDSGSQRTRVSLC